MATLEQCKKCVFSSRLHSYGSGVHCDYLNKMGKRRPYKGEECRLYKIKVKGNDRPKI